MADPFLAQISIVAFDFAPKGYAQCNGQLLPINQNQALFSLLGTMYGGNGQTNFALPNLKGGVPMHWGGGYIQGQNIGTNTVTLSPANMPDHSHNVVATLQQPVGATATELSPLDALPADAAGGSPRYSSKADDQMSKVPVSELVTDPGNGVLKTEITGSNSPINNMMPYLGLNYIIALQGVFPSQS
ncbi:MAG: phage tail protein [Chitinophaga sp.]|uniref:phage tail protein n=1 Tax=Chitinophaga sp. TaxID=1869181 RepID=UPI001B04A0B0|nr:tail fiber protein [Chitinophaga sp.]MBO9731412.1 phage tail protein [Chitinophaga sp.]